MILLSKPPIGSLANPSDCLAKGLVGWWLLNEGVGTIVQDYSGNGRRGGLVGNTNWVGGRKGHTLNFDGAGDYILVPTNCGLTDKCAVSMWFKGTDADAVIFSVPNTVSAGGVDVLAVASKPRFRIQTGVQKLVDGAAAINDGAWHHVVGTYDGSTIRIYVDGEIAAAPVAATGTLWVAYNTTYFGVFSANYTTGANSWTGLIDDVRIYNRALSPEEIQQTYAGAYPIYDPWPVLISVAGGELTASISPLDVSVTQLAITASYISELTASISPLDVSVTQLAITASYISELTASISPLDVSVTQLAITASYISELTASISPLDVSVTQLAITAYSGTEVIADILPINVSVTQLAVTASFVVELAANILPIDVSVTQLAITASYISELTANISAHNIVVSFLALTASSGLPPSIPGIEMTVPAINYEFRAPDDRPCLILSEEIE